jgi:hypothetical protein
MRGFSSGPVAAILLCLPRFAPGCQESWLFNIVMSIIPPPLFSNMINLILELRALLFPRPLRCLCDLPEEKYNLSCTDIVDTK